MKTPDDIAAQLEAIYAREQILGLDMFSGAGGFTTGFRVAAERLQIAAAVVGAVNHDDDALATHQANHPDVPHHKADVYDFDPRRAVPGGLLDLLMASPTCTFFSRARGAKPISWDQRRGRMTPTQVVRWASELDITCIIVENVEEFRRWGPVHRSEPSARCAGHGCKAGRPCRRREGYYFRRWLRKLERLGYRYEYRVLCCADFGDATTRERFFAIFRKDGGAIVWPTETHSVDGLADLFGAGAERHRPAAECIEWKLRGESIFTRKVPLAPNTIVRIYRGAYRYWWPEGCLRRLRRHMLDRGIPIPTDVERDERAGPFVLSQAAGGAARPATEPVPAIPTKGAHALLVPYYRTANARPADVPTPTITTRDRLALVVPVTHHDTSNRSRTVDRPLPTITGANRGELAFITASFGERKGQRARTRSLDLPAPTLCATGSIRLVQAAEDEDGEWDIEHRMFQPVELARAHSFTHGARVYKFPKNKTKATKQVGNSVPVYTAAALVEAVLRTLPKRVAA